MTYAMTNDASRPTIRILGTHGIPAAYGGFETAAENVAIYLRDRGWRVVVYCQAAGSGEIREDRWNGIERVTIFVSRDGWLGTSAFDWMSIRHALKFRDPCLTFGYNTAVFNILQRVLRVPNVINMDGIEWSRARWGKFRQAILYANERVACVIGDHLIADHPCIEQHLRQRVSPQKITTITYGAHEVTDALADVPRRLGLVPGRYLTLICRPISENSILELVQAFSARRRHHRLLVLGDYTPESDPYHRAVLEAASDEVMFPGAIYAPADVAALRFHSLGYLHGHTVGGTNPSLVEALAAGNPVIAHDNPYNRWVAQDAAIYFHSTLTADDRITELLGSAALRQRLSTASRTRHRSEFTWEHVAGQYESVLAPYVNASHRPPVPERKPA